jgi:uridine kinase
MAFSLEEINRLAAQDPAAFVAASEQRFNDKVEDAAARIIQNLPSSPIVLLAGPSGSGKTTTSLKLRDALLRHGVQTHTISLDDYFQTVSPLTTPRTPTGEYDFESPYCLDLELLEEHFSALERGEPICIPRYDFLRHMRDTSRCRDLTLGKDEIAVFEGIHALNSVLSKAHPNSFRIYLSARSDVRTASGSVAFQGAWMRLVRRSVRDLNFRGSEIQLTLAMWDNIRRGEKRYISPFKGSADLLFDSALPYEVGLMQRYADAILQSIPAENPRAQEMTRMVKSFAPFFPIDAALVPKDSILREFIGGGCYGAH